MLVAGELEIILSEISPEEKWSRLMLLKKLAYKTMKEVDESLRFRTFTSFKKKSGGKAKKLGKGGG